MTVTTRQRPGVYSVYTAAPGIQPAPRAGTAAIVAKSEKGTAGEMVSLTDPAQAAETFGAGEPMTDLIRLLLTNGAARVVAVPVREDAGYAPAFAALSTLEEVKAVVCDSTSLPVQQALRDSVAAASLLRRERVAVVPGGETETVSALADRAGGLNSERVIVTAPGQGGRTAAALAGILCGQTDPALPLTGAVLQGVSGPETPFSEEVVDALLTAGVTPLERLNGQCLVIRGVTSRTKTGGEPDSTWREVTTVLVADDVLPAIRRSLRARFPRVKNTRQTRDAIRSQVILELESKKAAEIIADYGPVTAAAKEDDPTVCLVTFSFTVAHGLEQIWLSAQIAI